VEQTLLQARTLDRLLAAKKTGSMFEAANDAYSLVKRAHTFWHTKTRWSVSVSQDDRLFDAALKWFLSDEADTKPPRSLKATYVHGSHRQPRFHDDLDAMPSKRQPGHVEMVFNETSQRYVTIGGQRVSVMLQRADQAGDGERSARSIQPDVLHFHCRSREGQMAVVEHLRQIAADQDKRKPALHLLDSWGSWSRRDDLPQREIKSVSLRAGQMERLRDDIQTFIDHEQDYVRRGMPYHRGYMLYGPPGTGKTSVVRALAAHFGLDLWYAPLGDLEKDTSLMSLINQVQPGSILLLEDVDVYHATRERDDSTHGASMAGLLNALDGVATPHGLITFMTTNDLDVIDKALLRPGRIDVQEEIGLPDQDQVIRLYESWYGAALTPEQSLTIEWGGTTAALTELFKQNLNDADSALLALQKRNTNAEERSVNVVPSPGGKKRNEQHRR
jgi:hypothetical protein